MYCKAAMLTWKPHIKTIASTQGLDMVSFWPWRETPKARQDLYLYRNISTFMRNKFQPPCFPVFIYVSIINPTKYSAYCFPPVYFASCKKREHTTWFHKVYCMCWCCLVFEKSEHLYSLVSAPKRLHGLPGTATPNHWACSLLSLEWPLPIFCPTMPLSAHQESVPHLWSFQWNYMPVTHPLPNF